MHPGTPVRLTGLSPGYTEVPTCPSALQRLTEMRQNLPIAEIMASAKDTLDSIRGLVKSPQMTETLQALRVAVLRSGEALAAVEKLARNVDGQVGPMAAEVKATAESARSALAEAERTINQVGKTADGTLAQAQGTLARLEPTVEVTLKDFQALARGLDEKVAKLSASLDRTLSGADDMLADGSPVRASANRLEMAEFHQWGAPLRLAVPTVLGEDLARLLPSEQVQVFPWGRSFTPDAQVLVEISRLEGALNAESVLAARWRILDRSGAEVRSGSSRLT